MNFARTREAHVRTLHIGDAPHLGSSRCCAIRKSIKRSSPARQCFGLLNEPEAKAAGPSGRSRGRAEHNTLIINQVLHMYITNAKTILSPSGATPLQSYD